MESNCRQRSFLVLLVDALWNGDHYWAPAYPYLATDGPAALSLFTHHAWIGGFFIVGTGLMQPCSCLQILVASLFSGALLVSIFLGFHAFGMYIHNLPSRCSSWVRVPTKKIRGRFLGPVRSVLDIS